MSKFNKEAIQDIFDAGRESVGNALRGPALKVIAVAGGIALVLSGCTVNAEPNPSKTPTSIETEIPSETCADFSARMQETLPQPGSAEWLAKKSELEMQVIPGEASSKTIERFGVDGLKMVYDSLIDYLPTDQNTLADCLDQIPAQSDNEFVHILGLDSVVDMSISAVVADTDELKPFRDSLKYNTGIFTAQAARTVILGGDPESGVDLTIATSRDDSTDSQIIGTYDYTLEWSGAKISGTNGAFLEQVPATDADGTVLMMTHKAPYGD